MKTMRKALLGFAIGALILAAPAMMLTGAQEDEIVLDACGEKQAAVNFPHKTHEEVGPCSACHHTQEELTAGGEAETCTSCHLNPEDAATPDCAQMSTSKNPYHKTCMGCHKKEGKGPTKCTECHPKG
jgi:hypothetical protein